MEAKPLTNVIKTMYTKEKASALNKLNINANVLETWKTKGVKNEEMRRSNQNRRYTKNNILQR